MGGLNPEAMAHTERAQELYEAGRLREAASEFVLAIKAEKSSFPQAYDMLGGIYLELEEYSDAIQAFEDGIREDPYYINLYNSLLMTRLRLANAYAETGHSQHRLTGEGYIGKSWESVRQIIKTYKSVLKDKSEDESRQWTEWMLYIANEVESTGKEGDFQWPMAKMSAQLREAVAEMPLAQRSFSPEIRQDLMEMKEIAQQHVERAKEMGLLKKKKGCLPVLLLPLLD